MSLYFITGNESKFAELSSFIPDLQRLSLDLPELQSLDPKEVIAAKLEAARLLRPDDSFIVEDTSLFFDALNGLPGPFIKWFEKSLSYDGLASLVQGKDAAATATVSIGYLPKGALKPVFFEGSIRGSIVPPRGKSGFGWDVIFVPQGYDETFAQLGQDVKDSLSMRRIAAERLKAFLDAR